LLKAPVFGAAIFNIERLAIILLNTRIGVGYHDWSFVRSRSKISS
jgi:hypothetical protein